MEAIADLELKSWPIQGIVSLSDKDAARMTHLADGATYTDMAPSARLENPIFDMGIPFNYMTAANATRSGYPVLLEASSVWKANDEELKRILSGSALITGGAARVIIDRGFGDFLGVEIGAHHTNTIQSEEYEDNVLPNVGKIRVPHRGQTGMKCMLLITVQLWRVILRTFSDRSILEPWSIKIIQVAVL